MKYVEMPLCEPMKLPFYLAMEEHVARCVAPTVDDDELFFMWQVRPTVIVGRNQLVNSEVNVDYCRGHGIEIHRRKSGGGCVYADSGNIMFSYIAKSANVRTTFEHYTGMVADMLARLGLNASATTRNDVLIGEKKVSGNAFYHIPGRSIVHGTMLYDTNLEHMAHAITPSASKLQSKGVASARSRITTLRERLNMGIKEFKCFVKENLCNGTVNLSESDVEHVHTVLEPPYHKSEWIWGNNPPGIFSKQERIEDVGECIVWVETRGNKIKKIDLKGDFFLLSDLDTTLTDRLIGVDYDKESVAEALNDVDTQDIILNLKTKQFINLLF